MSEKIRLSKERFIDQVAPFTDISIQYFTKCNQISRILNYTVVNDM